MFAQMILTPEQRSLAYGKIKERYALTHVERTTLDRSPLYPAVMTAAHRSEWATVDRLIGDVRQGTDR